MPWIAWPILVAFAFAAELDRARQLYQSTAYQEAIQALGRAQEPASLQLLGQCYYMLGEFKKASEAFEAALKQKPNDSALHHWLGKAYGRRAETSSFLTAPGYATRARREFEKAVELDPKNVEALTDLFEYYRQAPGFLGGGKDKAERIALRIAAVDPAQGHYTRALLAEQRGDFAAAEDHLRKAAEAAPDQIGRLLDLAQFLCRRGRLRECDAVFAQAERLNPKAPRLLYERADAFIKARRNLDDARTLLEAYLQSPLTPDDPPREQARKLLASVTASKR